MIACENHLPFYFCLWTQAPVVKNKTLMSCAPNAKTKSITVATFDWTVVFCEFICQVWITTCWLSDENLPVCDSLLICVLIFMQEGKVRRGRISLMCKPRAMLVATLGSWTLWPPIRWCKNSVRIWSVPYGIHRYFCVALWRRVSLCQKASYILTRTVSQIPRLHLSVFLCRNTFTISHCYSSQSGCNRR